jgi:hypothetical protein
MQTITLVISLLSAFGTFVVLLFLRAYLPTYFSEKAKNLAQKEDIQDLTRQVEMVKHEFSGAVERLRAQLDRASYVSKAHFDTEFRIYQEIWRELVDVRAATLSLRPVLDHVDPQESEEERKRKRGQRFNDAYKKLFTVIETNRPFYPAAIWQRLQELLKIARSEVIDYRYQNPDRDFEKYWKTAEANQKQILDAIERCCEAIRERLANLQEAGN